MKIIHKNKTYEILCNRAKDKMMYIIEDDTKSRLLGHTKQKFIFASYTLYTEGGKQKAIGDVAFSMESIEYENLTKYIHEYIREKGKNINESDKIHLLSMYITDM